MGNDALEESAHIHADHKIEEAMGKGEKENVIEMDVDEALEVGGPCGISQTVLQLLFMCACVTVTYHAVESYFTGNDPPWKCVSDTNDTDVVVNASTFCKINYDKVITSDSVNFYERCKLKRQEWEYSTDKDYSFVTEFDLICGKTAIAAFVSGSLFLGGLLGCMITGIIADKYGRKLVMIVSQALVIASSIGCSYAADVWQLTGARMILGGAQMACYAVGYTAILEFVAPSYRTVSGMMYQMMFCLSQLFIDLVAYYHREWRSLQFYSSFACALPLLFCFLSPNSPRWLTSKGKHLKAKNVLETIAKYNGNPLPAFQIKSQHVTENDSYTYLHLFKSWKLFLTTSVLSYIWITCALLYFAIALESSNLGGNIYQAFGLTAIADLPSYFTALLACNMLGRKKTVLGSTFFAGVFIGCAALVPQSYEYKYVVNIVLVMIAKFFTTSAFNGLFLWTFEIYPTVLRSQGSSYCVAWERFGAVCAPFLISVLQSINYILPYIIMCFAGVSCSLIGLVLPETNDCPTRETYQDFFDNSRTVFKTGNAEIEVSQVGCDNESLDKIEDVDNTVV